MQFCPPNDTFVVIWSDHGMSRCFMETLSSVITMAIILVCGIGQVLFYSKYSTSFESFPTVKSRLYNTQVFITFIMPLMSVIRFMLESSVVEPFSINGYMIVYMICDLIKWPFSYIIMKIEREKMLPTIPTKGHGLLLNIFWALCFVCENLKLISINKESWWFNLEGLSHKVEFSFFVFGYIGCFLLFVLGLKAPGIPYYPDVEQRPLLQSQRSTFRQMFKKLKLLVPFLWPRKSICLQIQVLICVLILIAGRFINVLTPLFYKRIVDALSGNPTFCWQDILVYVLLAVFQGSGSMGLLNNLRNFLWIKIQQYTSKEVQVNLFAHLHSLSLRWHLSRKTGEVLRVVDRGVASSNSLLSYVLFNILPTIVDILIAVIFFVTMFNAWFGFIIFTTMTLYLTITIVITEWRTKFRRSLNKCDNELRAKSVDSLLNFETVKYHNNEDFEVYRYSEAVGEYQVEEFKSTASLVFLNTAQILIMNAGFLVGAMLCAYLVSKPGHLTVGDYVLFSSYIMQLYVPLNWFGTYYRMIQQAFIDMENMFDLLGEQPEVVDKEDATELAIRYASIEFKNVSFSYNPERIILKNISFTIPPNSTVALVGPSGCGKTTILRLLFRLYDPTEGDILIDEQNIKDVKQTSLRSYIGVVPQDCILFNEPVLYNIHYGNVNASPDDVINAAKKADIHDRILTFPEGYHTVVGERGLKLSGGEKQRIAIARMILKDPTIILMDEATSSLDTQTERNIQTALLEYFNSQTTLVVAHRLSTVVNADQILVMNEGEIVERGSHGELLALEGVYSAMWTQQMNSDEEKNEEEC